MQSYHTAAGPKRPGASTVRYVVSLIVLIAVVGGIAWLAQYLPGRQRNAPDPKRNIPKKLAAFPVIKAQWVDPKKIPKSEDPAVPGPYPFKDCEAGGSGHYDFLFKNVAGEDVEIYGFLSHCDCTSVKACALPADEVARLGTYRDANPIEPLPYAKEPEWVDLQKGLDHASAENLVRIGADQGGAVRLTWVAKKSAGQELQVNPFVWFRTVADAGRRDVVQLAAQVRVMMPIQFYPPRTTAGVLTPGSTTSAQFDAWSSTRESFELKLASEPPDPLIDIQSRPLSKAECAALEKSLAAGEISTRVLAAYHVTITVHEARGGKQLEQGVFYRKFPVVLDGRATELIGPEVIGLVKGDVQVGGADDQGKIRFQSFDAKYGSHKTVKLAADAKIKLKTHVVQPSWVEVKLKELTKKPNAEGELLWQLDVTVPPDTRDARSFRDEDAVILQIGGSKRYVRIPLEGQSAAGAESKPVQRADRGKDNG